MAERPEVHSHTVHPTLGVTNVAETVAFYRDKLGFEVDFLWGEPATHAGVRLDTISIHFAEGGPNPDGFWIYLAIDDVDTLHDYYVSQGVEVLSAPQTFEWGMREFNLRDNNGYLLRFGHHDPKAGDPLKIERVDVPLRLEKRLAAVMKELAEHKGLSLDETMEEMILHSFEPIPDGAGQGVASPHTRRTLDWIAAAKKTHGIDYETHDSYRFVEQ